MNGFVISICYDGHWGACGLDTCGEAAAEGVLCSTVRSKRERYTSVWQKWHDELPVPKATVVEWSSKTEYINARFNRPFPPCDEFIMA